MQRVATVAHLGRYPVKSMRGEQIAEARVWWHGLEGDRRYAFVRAGNTSRFPWLTAREVPALLRYTPSFADLADPVGSAVEVATPAGFVWPLESHELLDEIVRA